MDSPGSLTDILRTVTDGSVGSVIIALAFWSGAGKVIPVLQELAATALAVLARLEALDQRVGMLERQNIELARRLETVEARPQAHRGVRLTTVQATPLGVEG